MTINIIFHIFYIFYIFILPGYGLTRKFLRNISPLETFAYSLGLGICFVPWLAVFIALFFKLFITTKFLLVIATVVNFCFIKEFIAFILYISRRNKLSFRINPVVFSLVLVVIIYYLNYEPQEYILARKGWEDGYNPKCFIEQVFHTVKYLNPDKKEMTLLYEHIQVTPGNVVFTSPFVAIWQDKGFHILYILLGFLIGIFSYLISNHLFRNPIINNIAILFATLNPYLLDINVVERNVIVLMLSLMLFYSIMRVNSNRFFIGLLLGLISGAGVKFLPLFFIIPALWDLHIKKSISSKNLILIYLGFMTTFLINLPHFHFFNPQIAGEDNPWQGDAWMNISLLWQRVPFLPYPNSIFLPLNVLNYWGIICTGLAIIGALHYFKEDKNFFIFLAVSILPSYLVLSVQGNWVKTDKMRLPIIGFFCLYVFLWKGIYEIFFREGKIGYRKLKKIILIIFFSILLLSSLKELNFPIDYRFYKRISAYPKEAYNYYKFMRETFTKIQLLPNYQRLHPKLNYLSKIYSNNGKQTKDIHSLRATVLSLDFSRLPDRAIFAKRLPVDYSAVNIDFTRQVYFPLVFDISDNWFESDSTVAISEKRGSQIIFDIYKFTYFDKSDPLQIYELRTVPVMTNLIKANHILIYNNTLVLKIPQATELILRFWINDVWQGCVLKIDTWKVQIHNDKALVVYCFDNYQPLDNI